MPPFVTRTLAMRGICISLFPTARCNPSRLSCLSSTTTSSSSITSSPFRRRRRLRMVFFVLTDDDDDDDDRTWSDSSTPDGKAAFQRSAGSMLAPRTI
eukprot:2958198-Rhodomonas_salina.3